MPGTPYSPYPGDAIPPTISGPVHGAQVPNPVLTGNRVVVYFNQLAVGYCTSVRCSDNYAPEPAANIGTMLVPEYVPTLADYTLSVGMMALEGASLYARSNAQGTHNNPVIPVGPVDDGSANHFGVLAGLEFSFAIYAVPKSQFLTLSGGSPITPTICLCVYTGVSYAQGDLDVQAHRIITYNAVFKARNRWGSLSSH